MSHFAESDREGGKLAEDKRVYTVTETREETTGVVTLRMLSGNRKPFFIAGQCITVTFADTPVSEGKAYSISSAPEEPTLAITVKALGEFSRRLCALREGDSFVGSEPYGFFYTEEKSTPLVLLAIGIGVTPFRGILLHALAENPKRDMLLCLGSRTVEDSVFKKEFDALAARFPNVRIRYFLSREANLPEGVEKGRMTVPRVLPFVTQPKEAEYMLCGSAPFVRAMKEGLLTAGIQEERIYTEAFFTK